jgi:plasmid stabilization system protein ParE
MIVELSDEAESDLEQIADYIAKDSPRRALSFVQELRGKCEALAATPKGFPLVPRYEQHGIRRRVHGSYLLKANILLSSTSCTVRWTMPPYCLRAKPMTEVFNRQDYSDLPSEDKMGFAVPKTPAHSLMLLNSYMRTDLLRHIHLRLHQMRDTNEPGAPLHQLAKSLEWVISTYDGVNLFEFVTRNSFHIDPDYEFLPEQD